MASFYLKKGFIYVDWLLNESASLATINPALREKESL